jgi:hypothetical protein
MGRLMALITGKKSDVFGICQDTNVVVAGAPSLAQTLLEPARFLLARLLGCVDAGLSAVQKCAATATVPSARWATESGSSRRPYLRCHARLNRPMGRRIRTNRT